jgi:hypothetical protein|tara:strand:- start:567 stop:776 length:210 start_codon:yes stop_codon:yes gene_type:complete
MTKKPKVEKFQHNTNKPIIETLINTMALALTSFGVIEITQNKAWFGFAVIAFAMSLEFAKYWGRYKNLW